MQKQFIKRISFFFLAIVFSVALMFAFIELPVWLESLLEKNIGFPGMDHGSDERSAMLTTIYIDALHLRWIGYISLVVILTFIIIGFITKRTGWAWAGAFSIFLPVFGQFALSMFFLSGLGILRAGWLPFMDISWNVLDLGHVIYLPYWILLWFFNLFGWYAHDFIAWTFMGLGALLFVWGVMEWFNVRFSQNGVAVRTIYKVSRHPQYLGWIIWSYGLMLFTMYLNNMKKSWGVSSSLPWLLMTMIIVAICFLEELKMEEKYGSSYKTYKQNTPFLFPLPTWIKQIIRWPARLITGKNFPQNIRDIVKITGVYTLGLMLLSLIWTDLTPGRMRDQDVITSGTISLDSLLIEIHRGNQGRRDYHKHIERVKSHQAEGVPVLLSLLADPLPEIREFAVYALGDLRISKAVTPMIKLLSDKNGRVRNAAIQALGKIGSKEATPFLLSALNNQAYDGFRYSLYNALADLKALEAIPYLEAGITRPPWYQQNSALNALYKLSPDTCFPYIIEALKDTNPQVRRNAVILLLDDLRPEALKPLNAVLHDEDFETRFFAKQAIKEIKGSR